MGTVPVDFVGKSSGAMDRRRIGTTIVSTDQDGGVRPASFRDPVRCETGKKKIKSGCASRGWGDRGGPMAALVQRFKSSELRLTAVTGQATK